MQGRFSRRAAAVLCVAVISSVTAGAHRIAFELQADALTIRVDDRPLATYVYRDPEILRPYFKDVCAPGGIQVTRHHPPREGIDPTDHAAMHPGLWLAFGDVGGADFWRNKATVEHGGFVQPPHVAGNRGTFTVRNRYMAGGIARVEGAGSQTRNVAFGGVPVPPSDRGQDARGTGVAVCEEVCTYTFQARPAGYLILWDSTFLSEQSGWYFGDQEEMGLGVRVATSIMAKPRENRGRPGRILDDHGRRNEKEIWGERAAWCDYSGGVDDTFAGIMVMPDPRNAAVCRWHTRDYGLMVANPFGQSVFRKGPVRRTEIAAGRPFHLRFGILIHAAHSEDSFDPAAAYRDYLKLAAAPWPSTPRSGPPE